MQKKLLIIFSFLLIFSTVGLFNPVSAEVNTSTLTPADISGVTKAYFDFPCSVAAADINGSTAIFIGDKNPSGIFVYYNGTVNKINYGVTSPFKLEVNSRYLFVYDRIKIILFDISQPSSINFAAEFVSDNIQDFYVWGDTMFVLYRNYTVSKYTVTLGETITFTEESSHDFSSYYPDNIMSLDADNFIIKNDDTFIKTGMTGSTEEILKGIYGGYARYYGGKLYYYNNGAVYGYDVTAKVSSSMQITQSAYPLSEEITSVSNLFVNESGLYICDNDAKKTVCLNPSDFSYISSLSSFSYDAGRYNCPSNVSALNGKIIVSDTLNDRVQVISGGNTQSFNISGPKFCVEYNGALYAVSDNKIYTGENFSQMLVLPQSLTVIKDIKVSADGRLYVLGESELYILNASGTFDTALEISGGISLSVNIKTGAFYVLKESSVEIYDKNFVFKNSVIITGVSGNKIETDFGGNIYILAGNYSGLPAVIKYGGSGYTETNAYLLSGTNLTASGASLDYETGSFYIVSSAAHAVFMLNKNELGISLANDIPALTLPENPMESAFPCNVQTIEIKGYPSTIFYPFDASLSGETFYPSLMAYEGDILYIETGEKLLSIYDSGAYRLVIYNGKLGFVLNDNIAGAKNSNAVYEEGRLLLDSDVYYVPYIVAFDGIYAFKAGSGEGGGKLLPKNTQVKILYSLSPYKGQSISWYYVEYTLNGAKNYGFINKSVVAAIAQDVQETYILGEIYSAGGAVNLYGGDFSSVISVINSGEKVKIYSYSGNYAQIEYTDSSNNMLRGYILKTGIAKDKTFERQKLGFILSFATIGLAIIFSVIRRKYFYN